MDNYELDFTQMLLDEDHAYNVLDDSYNLLTPPGSVTSPSIDCISLNTPERPKTLIKNGLTENIDGYNTEDIDDALLEALDPLLLNIDDESSKAPKSPTLSEINFLNSLFCPREIKGANKLKPKSISIGIQCSTSEMMFDKLRLQHPHIVPIDTNFYYNFKGLVQNEEENVSLAGDTTSDSNQGQQIKIKVTNLDYFNLKKDDQHKKFVDKETTDGYLIPHSIVINYDDQNDKNKQKEIKKKELLAALSNRITNILEDRYNKFKIKVYKKRERNLQRNLNLAYNSRVIKSQCKSRYSTKFPEAGQKKKQHPCHECYELFNTRNSLLTHMKLHRKPFCMNCLIFFQSEPVKDEHIKNCDKLILPTITKTPKKNPPKKPKVSIKIKNNNKNNLKSEKTHFYNIKEIQPMVIIERLKTSPITNPHLPIKTEIFSPSNNNNLNNSQEAILNITLKELDDEDKYFMQYKYDYQAISNLTGKTITNELGLDKMVNQHSYRDKKIIKNNKTFYKTDEFQIIEPVKRKYTTRSGRTVNMYLD